jgi:hypothetical protein
MNADHKCFVALMCFMMMFISCSRKPSERVPDAKGITEIVKRYEKAIYAGDCDAVLKLTNMTPFLTTQRDKYCSSLYNMTNLFPKDGSKYVNVEDVKIEDAGIKGILKIKYRTNDMIKIVGECMMNTPLKDQLLHEVAFNGKVLKAIEAHSNNNAYFMNKTIYLVQDKGSWLVDIDLEGKAASDDLWREYEKIKKQIDGYINFLCSDGKINLYKMQSLKSTLKNLQEKVVAYSQSRANSDSRYLRGLLLKTSIEDLDDRLGQLSSESNPCEH